jgi:thioredoxin-like negative regulator of GroEL
MRQLTGADIDAFVAAKPAAAVLFDAEWDGSYRPIVRAKMIEAESAVGQQANFGEVNCDRNPDLARSLPVKNVPLVAYYRDGSLVAALIGARQNIRARLERVLLREPIGYKDGHDAVAE